MKNNKAVMFMHVATPVIGNNHAYNTTYERIIKDIVETVKKKKTLKQMEENPADFITDVQGDYVPD